MATVPILRFELKVGCFSSEHYCPDIVSIEQEAAQLHAGLLDGNSVARSLVLDTCTVSELL